MSKLTYLDNNATTRPDPKVVEAMLPYLTDLYVNPSSAAGRVFGIDRVITSAKASVGRLLGDVDYGQNIVLTSGASESNSWAISSVIRGKSRPKMVTTAIEHSSVLAAFEAEGAYGADVVTAEVTSDGAVDLDAFAAVIDAETAFVSVMLANNETGVLQPIAELAAIVRAKAPGAIFHCDATQAVGRVRVDLVDELADVDLLSFSAHKFHGPKGIGGLFIRPGCDIAPLIHGEQEGGLRGGTMNAAAAAGLGCAADLAYRRLNEMGRVAALRDLWETQIQEALPQSRVIAAGAKRLPNTSSVLLLGIDASSIVDALALTSVIISTGSACQAGADAPSHVLTAMGLSADQARQVIRVSLSHENRLEEVKELISELRNVIQEIV